jgi:hypothetical protein
VKAYRLVFVEFFGGKKFNDFKALQHYKRLTCALG